MRSTSQAGAAPPGSSRNSGATAAPPERTSPSGVTRCHEANFRSGGMSPSSRSASGSCRATGRSRPARSQARNFDSSRLQNPQSSS